MGTGRGIGGAGAGFFVFLFLFLFVLMSELIASMSSVSICLGEEEEDGKEEFWPRARSSKKAISSSVSGKDVVYNGSPSTKFEDGDH